MSLAKPSAEAKRARVIEKNTFYFFDNAEQERHESHIHSLRETLARLKNRVESRPRRGRQKARVLTNCSRKARTDCARCSRSPGFPTNR